MLPNWQLFPEQNANFNVPINQRLESKPELSCLNPNFPLPHVTVPWHLLARHSCPRVQPASCNTEQCNNTVSFLDYWIKQRNLRLPELNEGLVVALHACQKILSLLSLLPQQNRLVSGNCQRPLVRSIQPIVLSIGHRVGPSPPS